MFSYARVQNWSDEEDEGHPRKEHEGDSFSQLANRGAPVPASTPNQTDGASTSATEPGRSADAPADPEDGQEMVGGESRELLIYAVPLMRNDVVFLPVTAWCDERPDLKQPEDWKQQMELYAFKIKTSASDTWSSMGEKESGFQKTIHSLGTKVVNSMSPEEMLMKAIPDNITKVIIRHPATVMPDVIMEKLTSMSQKQSFAATGKAALAGLALPLAFGLDVIIIPGPQVLTYYTLWQLYKNGSGAVGAQRLTRYVKQDGNDTQVRVNYVGDTRLDKYKEVADHSVDGVLPEDEVEALCAEIREPELLEALMALRKRHLGFTQKKNSKYTLLQNDA